MDVREWLGLEGTVDATRWRLPVTPGNSTGGGFLFGGCGLGAAISAMEGATDRPIIWATAQYLSFARPGSTMDIAVTVAAEGRATSQVRAVGRVGDDEILTVNGAVGRRDFEESGQWQEMPTVPRPEDCPPRESRWRTGNSIMDRLDQRWALQDPARGRHAVWSHMPDLLGTSAPALAVLGDYVPLGIAATLTTDDIMSNSLDNTLRVASIVPTDWVLVDIQLDLVANGFGHGTVYLWSEDGTLMATASQSAVIRHWRPPDQR